MIFFKPRPKPNDLAKTRTMGIDPETKELVPLAPIPDVKELFNPAFSEMWPQPKPAADALAEMYKKKRGES